MEYKYFTLDKNPKQFKRISIGEYSIELRIEWNTRSKAWYVLGYSGDEIVISNVKMTPNQLYSIDIDSEYDLPYMIGIVPKYTNYDWDTETTFLIVDNPLSNTVEGLTVDGGVIKRSIATSSDTHSRKALKGTENKYLFDVVSITQDTGITIVCNGADASFKTVNLPQGRWDFTINGLRTITADTEAFRSLMNDYGVQIVNVGNNEYLWSNNSNQEIKIEGLYPYAAGYDFNVVESSNESAKIHSVDNNDWVNRFTVCLVPASSLIWTITSGGVSSDYQYVNFTGEKSVFESTAKLSTTQALVEKYRGGIDPYSATIVNELTGVSDWVLDPANNRIKYYETNETNELEKGFSYGCSNSSANKTLQSTLNTCNASLGYKDVQLTSKGKETLKLTISSMSIGSKKTVLVEVSVARPNDTPAITDMIIVVKKLGEVEQEEKYLPLPVVAEKVISNAESGNVDAQKVALSAALSDSLIKSLSDVEMRDQDVVNEIINDETGVQDWNFDDLSKVIRYIPATPDLNGVASVITQRYSANPLGFVGMAAFHGLMEGIGWVMDEGGKVTRPPSQQPTELQEYLWRYVTTTPVSFSSIQTYTCYQVLSNDGISSCTPTQLVKKSDTEYVSHATWSGKAGTGTTSLTFKRVFNPSYDPDYIPENQEVDYEEIQTALKNAIEVNNPTLATSIADAVKSAYSYDYVSGGNELYNSSVITYKEVAAEISNSLITASQEVISLLESYTNQALIKFTDVDSLISQFEANKQPK